MKLSKRAGALCFSPVYAEDLASVSRELLARGFPGIPEGYAGFLRTSDGYAWNGYEFFGTRRGIRCGDESFMLSDIVAANRKFRALYGLGNKLLLGRWDISYYMYNEETKKYEELESDSRDVMLEFDTFEALFTARITGY